MPMSIRDALFYTNHQYTHHIDRTIGEGVTSYNKYKNNFHSLEVVDRVSETQLQVGENYLRDVSSTIHKTDNSILYYKTL